MQHTETTEIAHSSQQQQGPAPLVRHARRRQWGRGLVLWTRENKRACLFEDGRMRVFMRQYFTMLEPAATPAPAVRMRLRAQALADGLLDTGDQTRVSKPTAAIPSLNDQIDLFESLYPEGFHGDAWVCETRDRPGQRRVKRLRDPAIADAAEQLDRAILQELIDAKAYTELRERMVEVLRRTDLVSRKQLKILQDLRFDADMATAWFGFLHGLRTGDQAEMLRLRVQLAKNHVERMPWQLMTGARALLYPNDHMCVRASVVRAQARLLMPGFSLGNAPTAADYSRSLEIAMSVRETLTRAELGPRDLFDVTEFMRLTLANKHKNELYGIMDQRRKADVPAV